MIKFIKSLFTPKAKPVVESVPPQGEIARKVCELFTFTLVHKGDENYEIWTKGNYTDSVTGVYRNGKVRASNYFHSLAAMNGAK